MLFLFKIGFLPVSFWDILDVTIVGYLIYRVYVLLRGSIAFNIFTGVVMLYVVWWLVGLLKMDMLSMLLSQFVNVGFIIIIIIFQPEVRRFLLLLGNTTLRGRSNMIGRWLALNLQMTGDKEHNIKELSAALQQMSRDKTGALVVFSKNLDLDAVGHSGVPLDAKISLPLLLSIFQKESPLHDGAVIIGKGKILQASRILPVSESTTLPDTLGLRHRAGLGITERTMAVAFIVSEATGSISYAVDGRIEMNISGERLETLLKEHFN